MNVQNNLKTVNRITTPKIKSKLSLYSTYKIVI